MIHKISEFQIPYRSRIIRVNIFENRGMIKVRVRFDGGDNFVQDNLVEISFKATYRN